MPAIPILSMLNEWSNTSYPGSFNFRIATFNHSLLLWSRCIKLLYPSRALSVTITFSFAITQLMWIMVPLIQYRYIFAASSWPLQLISSCTASQMNSPHWKIWASLAKILCFTMLSCWRWDVCSYALRVMKWSQLHSKRCLIYSGPSRSEPCPDSPTLAPTEPPSPTPGTMAQRSVNFRTHVHAPPDQPYRQKAWPFPSYPS